MTTLLEHLANKPPADHAMQGQWHNIRICPDLGSGELLNVGVALRLADGSLRYRLIDGARRLACLFGGEIEAPTLQLLAALRQQLAQGELHAPSPNILFSASKPLIGHDADLMLDELFAETVTLAREDEQQEETAFASMNTEKVRKLVFDALRQKTGLTADRIIGQQQVMEVLDGDRPRHLDIPLQGPAFLGSVISGWYKSPASVERNILRADMELGAARRIFGRDRLGLFILRPGQGQIPEPALLKLDNLIDRLEWMIRSQDMALGVRESEDDLAADIAEWASA